jgi:signal transduction histidine kinase
MQTVMYDLNQGIEHTLKILQHEIKYTAEIEKKLTQLPRIECFGGEINQVLLNIIMNALQAIKDEKKSGLGKIIISTEFLNDKLICKISDNGPGIPQEIMSKIFDPFFTTKDVGHGTGLGLSISYDIIRKHNGELSVESKMGAGATFTLTLPAAKPKKEAVT